VLSQRPISLSQVLALLNFMKLFISILCLLAFAGCGSAGTQEISPIDEPAPPVEEPSTDALTVDYATGASVVAEQRVTYQGDYYLRSQNCSDTLGGAQFSIVQAANGDITATCVAADETWQEINLESGAYASGVIGYSPTLNEYRAWVNAIGCNGTLAESEDQAVDWQNQYDITTEIGDLLVVCTYQTLTCQLSFQRQ